MAGEGDATWQKRVNPQKEIGLLGSKEEDQMLDKVRNHYTAPE